MRFFGFYRHLHRHLLIFCLSSGYIVVEFIHIFDFIYFVQYGHSVQNNGAPVTSKYIRERVVLTIPPFTAHWLRHTFATMLYLAGVNVEVAKEQLGHSDIKTTLNIYTHLDKIYKIKNMNKLCIVCLNWLFL
jgi:site-specific recombinase XerD